MNVEKGFAMFCLVPSTECNTVILFCCYTRQLFTYGHVILYHIVFSIT